MNANPLLDKIVKTYQLDAFLLKAAKNCGAIAIEKTGARQIDRNLAVVLRA